MGKSGGGGGGGSVGPEAERLAGTTADIAKQIYDQTQGLRGSVVSALAPAPALANAPLDLHAIQNNPIYAPVKFQTEQQFDQARNRVLEDIPRGGALWDNLANVEIGRAGALANARGAIAEREFGVRQNNMDRAMGIASGGATQSLGGLAQAGSLFSQLQSQQFAQQQAEAQQRNAGKSGAGRMVGMLGSAAIGRIPL